MCRSMCRISYLFIFIALFLAFLVTFFPQKRLLEVVYISRFFDIMIPVLSVGALIKYLTNYRSSNNKEK